MASHLTHPVWAVGVPVWEINALSEVFSDEDPPVGLTNAHLHHNFLLTEQHIPHTEHTHALWLI